MLERITAWSISRLFDFEACAYRAYLKLIKKAPQPELPEDHPLVRGRNVHAEVENYIAGQGDFPSTGKKLKDEIDYCRDQYASNVASVEERWGFNRDWDTTDWFSEDIWCRMATDCHVVLAPDESVIYDWKTGKSFGNEVKYMQQMQLYAVGAFMRFPDLKYVDVKLGFLDDGKLRTKSFERGEKINKLVTKFTERANRMTECVDFRPSPNVMNCKFCPFGKNGTNVCVYAVEPL